MAIKKNGLLSKLNFTATPESNELELIGSLSDLIAEGVDSVRMSTKTPGIILFVDDSSQFIGFSKSLQSEVTKGAITTPQLGHCSVIKGENADGDERYYLTLPQDYSGRIDANVFMTASNRVSKPSKVMDFGLDKLVADKIG
jgi:hypothetical protein